MVIPKGTEVELTLDLADNDNVRIVATLEHEYRDGEREIFIKSGTNCFILEHNQFYNLIVREQHPQAGDVYVFENQTYIFYAHENGLSYDLHINGHKTYVGKVWDAASTTENLTLVARKGQPIND